ncbi:phage antirepressor protein [Geobacter soli]|uniref:Phage antirepressor protein n=1 Tax=Geobacter soli TaxID=1510391 RepID=A0A0C1R0W4_9BACT|nr:phage antirepressor protein [Geobacter soli]
MGEGDSQLILFKGKQIRQVFHDDEWFFSIVDVIEAITGTERPRQYWNDLKKQLTEKEGFSELSDFIVQLKMPSSDGKKYNTDAVNTETLFRIVQSIPSPKAEPFKKWLAKVAYERIQEFQNPEIAIKRALLIYKVKGYSDEWINARIQTIVSRKELTREWAKRGIKEGMEYAILTDIISKGTFGLGIQEHKKLKGLNLRTHNLRDHMSPLELALTMLGETTTAELARNTDAQGFKDNEYAATTGGKIAGDTRKSIEKKLGKPVVTRQNFLNSSEEKQEKLPSK